MMNAKNRWVWLGSLLLWACGNPTGTTNNMDVLDTSPAGDCIEFNVLNGRSEAPNHIHLYFGLHTCEGEPISGLDATDFMVFEDHVPVLQSESVLSRIPTTSGFALYTILLLDVSGSILESDDLSELQSAVKDYIDRAEDGHAISIGIFDGRPNPEIVLLYSDDKAALKRKVDGLTDYELVDSSTNLNGAIMYGLNQHSIVSELFVDPSLVVGNLVVFTDGTDLACGNVTTSCGDGYSNNTATIAAVQQSPMRVFSIGMGQETDPEYLESIGKDGHILVDSGAELGGVFAEVADMVNAASANLYVLGYCTPKRGGEHQLSVRVHKDDCADGADPCLETGSLDFNFSADGFYDDCDEELLREEAELFLEKNCLQFCAFLNATDLFNIPEHALCLTEQTGLDADDLLDVCDVASWGNDCDGCIVKLNGTEFQCGIVHQQCF